jgi:uncharacterized FlgJ-related protein
MKTIVIQDHINLTEKLIPKSIILLYSLIILLIFLFIGYTIGSLNTHPNTIEKIVYSDNYLIKQYNEPFSEKALNNLLLKLKVKHIDIILNQSKIETGYYKSQVFLENNNLFGMRQPENRITTAIGSNLNHAVYNTWQESVIDYAIYQSTYLKNMNRKEYLLYLHNNYAKNKNYVNLINQLK